MEKIIVSLSTFFNPLVMVFIVLLAVVVVFTLWCIVGRIPKQERSSDQKQPRSAWFDNP